MENIKVWKGKVPGYKLLDSGNKCKLEEIGGIRIARNEPRAWWKTNLETEEWKNISAFFGKEKEGRWEFKKEIPQEVVIETGIEGVKIKAKFGGKSKHIGIFPEQSEEWQFVKEKIEKLKKEKGEGEVNILNLFGYTGIVSLVAAKAGAKVTHVDASKYIVEWARENQQLSGMEGAPIRWIVDDVVKFLKREIKRGQKYDAIIMDPPSYGKGPNGEVWKIEDELPKLMESCRELLSNDPLFVIFNMYSTELSSISVGNMLGDMMRDYNGIIGLGELALTQDNSDRLLPMSIFAIWESTEN